MLLKIDENLHPSVADLLRQHGHDAMTVYDQGLRGHADKDVADVCQREGRVIVTLDLDFSDIRTYPPENFPGIIVLRLIDQSRPAVIRVLQRIIPLFTMEQLGGCLWIVDETKVRIRRGGNA